MLCWLSRKLIRPLKHSVNQQKSFHVTRKVRWWAHFKRHVESPTDRSVVVTKINLCAKWVHYSKPATAWQINTNCILRLLYEQNASALSISLRNPWQCSTATENGSIFILRSISVPSLRMVHANCLVQTRTKHTTIMWNWLLRWGARFFSSLGRAVLRCGYWLSPCPKIPDAKDSGNTGEMYKGIKQAVEAISAPIESKQDWCWQMHCNSLTAGRNTSVNWSALGLKFQKAACLLSP